MNYILPIPIIDFPRIVAKDVTKENITKAYKLDYDALRTGVCQVHNKRIKLQQITCHG